MPDFTAKDVQSLRHAAGVGMMDAKKALEATGGDMDAATKWLREQGLAKAATRDERENTQGSVAVSTSDGVAAAVLLKCETDFVAKSDRFVEVAQQLADAVAEEGEAAVESLKDAVDDLKVTLKENIDVGPVARVEAADGEVLDTYLHRQEGRGVNAVIVALKGGTPEQAHAVALHIAFSKPRYLSRDEVPGDAIAAERETLESITRAEGKPEQAVPKIVEGRLNAWIADQVLLEQKMIPEEKTPVAAALGDATVTRFAQVRIGA